MNFFLRKTGPIKRINNIITHKRFGYNFSKKDEYFKAFMTKTQALNYEMITGNKFTIIGSNKDYSIHLAEKKHQLSIRVPQLNNTAKIFTVYTGRITKQDMHGILLIHDDKGNNIVNHDGSGPVDDLQGLAKDAYDGGNRNMSRFLLSMAVAMKEVPLK